jgi:hypothetical protein
MERELIHLGRPIRTERVRGFQPPWRTVYVYKCSKGHTIRFRANRFRGTTPEPGGGAVTCPQCDLILQQS